MLYNQESKKNKLKQSCKLQVSCIGCKTKCYGSNNEIKIIRSREKKRDLRRIFQEKLVEKKLGKVTKKGNKYDTKIKEPQEENVINMIPR